MLAGIITHPLFIAALTSFFAGLMGYAVAWFWIRPVGRYRLLRRRTRRVLADAAGEKPDGREQWVGECRKLAVALAEAHAGELPPWYRILLARRGEDPVEASRHLMALADTRDPGHARQRADKVRTALALGAAEPR